MSGLPQAQPGPLLFASLYPEGQQAGVLHQAPGVEAMLDDLEAKARAALAHLKEHLGGDHE